ncbi:MAG TPA: hypothetical protein VF617_00175 [Sphingomonas sp.]|jgi:cytochrome b561
MVMARLVIHWTIALVVLIVIRMMIGIVIIQRDRNAKSRMLMHFCAGTRVLNLIDDARRGGPGEDKCERDAQHRTHPLHQMVAEKSHAEVPISAANLAQASTVATRQNQNRTPTTKLADVGSSPATREKFAVRPVFAS